MPIHLCFIGGLVMKRKINLVGQNTLTVSLPSKWARKYHLKKGEEIEVVEKGRNLIINHQKESLLGEKVVDLTYVKSFARRMIMMPYVHGYDSIKIHFKDKETLYKIKECMRFFLGFELVEETPRYCVLKNIAQGIESEFLTMVNRLLYVVLTMGKDLYQAMKQSDFQALPRIKENEEVANKLNVFCRRMLNLKGSQDKRETTTAYAINCYLEAVTDAYRDICDCLSEQKTMPSKRLLEFFQKILKQFNLFLDIYRKFEPAKITAMKKIEQETLETYKQLGLNGKEMVIAGFLIRAHFSIRHASEELE